MPQITCPNCGTTINLENRRELDYSLIRNATDKRPRTFTELLHITKLSRKTLNSRLKEMCAEGILMKCEGMYKSNGASNGNNGGHVTKGLSRVFDDRRVQTGLILVALLVTFSASGYVLGTMVVPTAVEPVAAPSVLGNFTMVLSVNNVSNLYAWQAAVVFNDGQMRPVEVTSGSFLRAQYPLFLNSTDTAPGLLLLYGGLEGNVPGVTGSGTLARIVFGYYVKNYELPCIVNQDAGFSTYLENSTPATIPAGQTMLTLAPAG
jgi:hypothetical protein